MAEFRLANGKQRCTARHPKRSLGGGEQVDVVEDGDQFAADDELLEIIAILERAAVDDSLPERDRSLFD